MKICPVCGRTYDISATFCAECGVALMAQEPVSAPAPIPAPVTMMYSTPAAPEKKEPAVPVSVALFTFFSSLCNIFAATFGVLEFIVFTDYLTTALLFAVSGVIVGVIGLIITACQKPGAYYVFSRISALVLSTVLLITLLTFI